MANVLTFKKRSNLIGLNIEICLKSYMICRVLKKINDMLILEWGLFRGLWEIPSFIMLFQISLLYCFIPIASWSEDNNHM